MNSPLVIAEERVCADGRVLGVACIHSEKTLHSLSVGIIEPLLAQLQAWATDDRVAAVFLHSTGEKAFCAGGDVKSICVAVRANGIDDSTALQLFSTEYRLDYLIHTYPKPLIVWATGIVMGGGIGLLMGASHRVITETSRLAMPEITIGLYPDVAGSWLLGRMGKIGLFLGLTGANFNGQDALAVGLANAAVASQERTTVLEALQALTWATERHERDQQIHQLLAQCQRPVLAEGYLAQHQAEISQRMQADDLPSLYQALIAPSDKPWLEKAASSLRRGSPTSAWLIYRQWLHGQQQSLAETFRQELVLSVQCARHPDFIEGVRALLVDKDQQPQWQPATLAEVTEAWLDGHYVVPWVGEHPLQGLE